MKTVAQMTAKFLRGMQQGQAAYTDGINAVTEAPSQAAINAKPLWEMRMQEAIAENRWVAGLQNVTLEQWKNAARNGAQKYGSAAQAATAKWSAFAQQAKPVWDEAKAAVKAMPKGTKADSLNRVARNMEIMATLRGKRGKL